MNLTIRELLEELTILPEYENYFDKEEETVKGLTEDILGVQRIIIPLIVNKRPDGDLVLLDGHTRISIAKQHLDILGNTNVDIEYKQFGTPLEEKLFILRFQCNRRNLPNTNAFKLKIGKLAAQVASFSKSNNQYATYTNDPSLTEDDGNNETIYVSRSDECQLALTTPPINLSTLSKDTNIPTRTIKRHAQVYNNLTKLAKEFSPQSVGSSPDLSFFNVLFERKQISTDLIKEMVERMDNKLFNSKIKSLLRRAVMSTTLNIKSEWLKIKSNINTKKTKSPSKSDDSIKKQTTSNNKFSTSTTTTELEYSLDFFEDNKNQEEQDIKDLFNRLYNKLDNKSLSHLQQPLKAIYDEYLDIVQKCLIET